MKMKTLALALMLSSVGGTAFAAPLNSASGPPTLTGSSSADLQNYIKAWDNYYEATGSKKEFTYAFLLLNMPAVAINYKEAGEHPFVAGSLARVAPFAFVDNSLMNGPQRIKFFKGYSAVNSANAGLVVFAKMMPDYAGKFSSSGNRLILYPLTNGDGVRVVGGKAYTTWPEFAGGVRNNPAALEGVAVASDSLRAANEKASTAESEERNGTRAAWWSFPAVVSLAGTAVFNGQKMVVERTRGESDLDTFIIGPKATIQQMKALPTVNVHGTTTLVVADKALKETVVSFLAHVKSTGSSSTLRYIGSSASWDATTAGLIKKAGFQKVAFSDDFYTNIDEAIIQEVARGDYAVDLTSAPKHEVEAGAALLKAGYGMSKPINLTVSSPPIAQMILQRAKEQRFIDVRFQSGNQVGYPDESGMMMWHAEKE